MAATSLEVSFGWRNDHRVSRRNEGWEASGLVRVILMALVKNDRGDEIDRTSRW